MFNEIDEMIQSRAHAETLLFGKAVECSRGLEDTGMVSQFADAANRAGVSWSEISLLIHAGKEYGQKSAVLYRTQRNEYGVYCAQG